MASREEVVFVEEGVRYEKVMARKRDEMVRALGRRAKGKGHCRMLY